MADKNYKLHFNMTDGTTQELQFTVPSGETPEKGVDYFTKADKEEFLSEMNAVQYAEQSLAEEQKTQARENIGAVAKAFVVNFTESESDALIASKTPTEIFEAQSSGRYIYGFYNGVVLPLCGVTTDTALFVLNSGNEIGQFFVFSDKTVTREMFTPGLEPLVGMSEDITPAQIMAAIEEGRGIALTYTDEIYGPITFNGFLYTPGLNTVMSSGIATIYSPVKMTMRFTLLGLLSDNSWVFEYGQILQNEDIVTYTLSKEGSNIILTGTDGTVQSIEDSDTEIIVDENLSQTSTNPVMNKTVAEYLFNIETGFSALSSSALKWDGNLENKEFVPLEVGSNGNRLLLVHVSDRVPDIAEGHRANIVFKYIWDGIQRARTGTVTCSLEGLGYVFSIDTDGLTFGPRVIIVPEDKLEVGFAKGIYFVVDQYNDDNDGWKTAAYTTFFDLYGFSFAEDTSNTTDDQIMVEKEFSEELSITGFVRTNGTLSPAESGLRTDYIPMENVTKIFGNAGFYSSCSAIAFYDAAKNPLSDINVIGTDFITSGYYGEGTFELDVTGEEYAAATYFIVSTYRATNQSYTQTFEDDFCKYIKLVPGEATKAPYYRIAENKIAFFGDSITAGSGDGGYPSLIGSITGAKVTNYARSGATLATGTTATYHIAEMVNTYTGNEDIVCISGGINDMNKSVPIGVLTEGYEEELDTSTVIGALENIFRDLLTNHTTAQIFYVITHKAASAEINANSLGLTFTNYHDAIVSVLEKYSIPFYDAFADSGFITSTYGSWGETMQNLYTVNGDGVHPNTDGYMKYYVYPIIAMMEHGLGSSGSYNDRNNGVIEDENGTANAPPALNGSADDITPEQVMQAIQSGQDVIISCQSNNYGTLTFTSFHLAGSGTIVASSCAIETQAGIINASLGGNTISNEWVCTTPTLATLDDIPDALSDLSDDTTHRLVTDAEKATWNAKVDKVTGKGLSTNDYTSADKEKLDNTNIAYGTCSTAADVAEKAVVLSGNTQWSLNVGSIIIVKFAVSNSAESVKINVNDTGAYPIWYNNAEYTSTGTAYTGYANRTITYMFNGTHYVWITASYDVNSTYTNAALGQGYATCSTAASTTAKVGTLSSYKLVTGGIVAVKFTNAVPADATLNINSTGAKSIYFRGAKITADVIKAGDVATFVYSSYYHLISIDRWQNDISTIQNQISGLATTDYVDNKVTDITPVKGVDYFTEADKEEFLNDMDVVRYSEQSLTEEHKAQARANIGARHVVTPQDYGAKGDGSTDDTAAFQNALANNRVVYIPGGTYNLSGELVIRDNCHLELAQDVVLNFTQTSGNCITMNRAAFLKGNHATVNVPYAFTGRVINVDTTVHTSTKDVPPFIHWDPQWKTGRYLTDLNICKADSAGLHRSTSGDSNGTAVYIYANGSATSTFIWGLNFSGLRIAGAFEYGLRAISTGYNHEMRFEAFMDALKIGVSLEDCNNAYISATVQPRAAADGTVYAKHGIQLIRSENTDLLGSRVWDWNDKTSLWTYEKDNVNQHIAMYGDCSGTILNDYNYFHIPAGFTDLRELIYTDTQSNYDSLVIIQEPFTKWFKPIDHEPYFNNGSEYERLVLKKEQDALFETTYIPTFIDQLAKATDGKGAIFNEIGYKKGFYWNTDGVNLTSSSYHTSTGYIPCQAGSVLHVKGMSMSSGNDDCRVVLLDSSFTKLMHVNRGNILAGGNYFIDYVETEDGFNLTIKNPSTVAYVVISVYTSTVSNNPAIAVDEEIGYTQVGTMSSGIKVNSTNLINMDGYETKGRMVTQISNASTDAQYPSAKAVYDLVNGAFASYVTDIAALVGGDA